MDNISMSSPINNIQAVSGMPTNQAVSFRGSLEQIPDSFEYTNSSEVLSPPNIGTMRLAFSRLTDKQIEQINKTGRLPKNAKFCMNGYGGYSICNNFFNFRVGTQKLPEGFEVRKNILGFAVVLPKECDGAFLK